MLEYRPLMGIPRLTAYLSPFAVTTILGRGECDEGCPHTNAKIIIDGPCFAYHVYHQLLAGANGDVDHFNAVPSYRELGEAALQLLQGLERGGVVM